MLMLYYSLNRLKLCCCNYNTAFLVLLSVTGARSTIIILSLSLRYNNRYRTRSYHNIANIANLTLACSHLITTRHRPPPHAKTTTNYIHSSLRR
ncbi:hypothetical protein BDB00DRAFT_45317 [Zychaea mexicana]|uniref:uncharacterized protein n=1 Tax=Zychaea mexicana TaxID=64656 RepID=UPI0022FF326B|nr:uncharacterized protein BDB00DRAFT_45317 [Zychaea mexicana]KAI9488422.1 hypothetical protein BDB00DRAFT_45317 [Zychaea mexicana]